MIAYKYGSGSLNNVGLTKEEQKMRFLKAYNPAAQEKGYADYDALPEGVKWCIGHVGGHGSAWYSREIDTTGPKVEDADLELLPVAPPKAKYPWTHMNSFRRVVLRHSWWYLELHAGEKE